MSAFSDSASESPSRKTATASVRLSHEAGLHARPAVKLTKLAKKFASRIFIANSPEGPWIDAKSIVKLMATKTPRDAILHFQGDGEDAELAVRALVALIEQDFPDDG